MPCRAGVEDKGVSSRQRWKNLGFKIHGSRSSFGARVRFMGYVVSMAKLMAMLFVGSLGFSSGFSLGFSLVRLGS